MLQPGRLPEVLSLNINGNNYHWELGTAAEYSEQEYQRNRHVNWLHKDNRSIRHSVYYSLYKLLYPLPQQQRSLLLDEICNWAAAQLVVRPTHRTLTQAEIYALAQGEFIEIGAHTITHPFLATLPVSAQRQEITSSKALLEEILGHPVRSFAYPHGNFSAETKNIVQEVGFNCACTTVAGSVRKNSDRFALSRVVVEDWNGEEFARRLSAWIPK